MHRSRPLALAVVAYLVLVVVPPFGDAQQLRPPTMADRLAVAADLRNGASMAQKVIAMLGTGLASEGLKQADATLVKGYLMWNKALSGVQHIEVRSRFPDPMLPHVTKIINDARMTISVAHTALANAAASETGRSEQIGVAIENLNRAIQLAERAALLIGV